MLFPTILALFQWKTPLQTERMSKTVSFQSLGLIGSCAQTIESYLIFTWLYVETARRIVLLFGCLSEIRFVIDLSDEFRKRKKMLSLLGLRTGIGTVLQNRTVLNWSKTKYMDVPETFEICLKIRFINDYFHVSINIR